MSCIKITNKNCGCGWLQSPQIHFMQFTGLHDKNGNEGYEHDIVHDLIYPEQYFEIVWKDGKFVLSTLRPKGCEGMTEDITELEEMKIVGNRYMHPHFLEVQ